MPTNNFDPPGFTWHGPPPKRPLFIPIYRAPIRGVVCAVGLTPKIWGCMTHFVDLRTIPCTGDNCKHCHSQVARWRGFIGCWSDATQRKCILEVTAGAVDACGPDIWDAPYSFRGRVLTLSRRTARKHSPVQLLISSERRDESQLVGEVDVVAALRRIWSIPGDPFIPSENLRPIAEQET